MKFNKNEFGWKEKVSINTDELVTKKYVDENNQLCWLEDYEATGDRLQYADVNVSSLTSRVFYAFNFKKHPGVTTVRLLKSYDDGTIKSIINLGSTLEYMYLMNISSSIMKFYLKYATGIVSQCVCTFGNTSDECTFERTPMVLYAKNTYEYIPTTDYNPATKKYVDDKFIALDLMETVGTIPQSELQKCNNGTSRYVSSIDFDTLFSEPNNYLYYATYKDDTLIPIQYQSNYNRMVTRELDSVNGLEVIIGFNYGTHMMYPFNGGNDSIKAYTFTNDLIIKRCPILNVNEVATREYVDEKSILEPLPIYDTVESESSLLYIVNIMDLDKRKTYGAVQHGIDKGTIYRFVYICDDGSKAMITSFGDGVNENPIRVWHNTNSSTLYYGNYYYNIDYTNHATRKDVVVTQKIQRYLNINNNIEYTPSTDYNPATKKYVDDAIANQPTFSFNDSGELVVTINGVSKTFVPKQ